MFAKPRTTPRSSSVMRRHWRPEHSKRRSRRTEELRTMGYILCSNRLSFPGSSTATKSRWRRVRNGVQPSARTKPCVLGAGKAVQPRVVAFSPRSELEVKMNSRPGAYQVKVRRIHPSPSHGLRAVVSSYAGAPHSAGRRAGNQTPGEDSR